MYKMIVVPLDGSNLSAEVLPYVRWLARSLNVPVELMHVNDRARLAPHSATIQSAEYLGKTAESFSGTSVKCSVEEGNPAERIIHAASAEPGTLVAMATHGYSGAVRWLLGSVAEKVLRALTSDLLLVRPQGANGNSAVELKSVLVPLDRSPPAEMVLPTVSSLAQLLNLEVLLVHVTKRIYTAPPDAFLPVFGSIPNLKELWEQDKAVANKYLTEKVDQLRAQGLTNLSFKVIEGGIDGAAAEIIDAAQKISGSVIAMTSHGQTGIGRWLIGSITDRVACHSRTPMLVVRSQVAAAN